MSLNKQPILLIGVDGIGLDDLKNNRLKSFDRIFSRGVSGRLKIAEHTPPAAVWASLATGCTIEEHGISGAAHVDEDNQVRAAGPADWARPAFWNLLDRTNGVTHRINLPARHPEAAEAHCLSISEYFFAQLKCGRLHTGRAVQPHTFSPIAEKLSIRPEQVDHATLSLFVPDLEKTDSRQEPLLRALAGHIGAALSIQAIAGQTLAELDWDCFMIRFTLAEDVRLLCRKSESDTGLTDTARKAALHTLDLCLDTLRRLAGQHTLVLCSTHGAGGGFIACEGPGIRKGETLAAPRPEDIAPTLLNLLGCTAPPHMNGRVLDELFLQPARQTATLPPAAPPGPAPAAPTPKESRLLLPPYLLDASPWKIEAENNRQKAAAHRISGEWFESIPHLLVLHHQAPFSRTYALQLCEALIHSELIAEAVSLMNQTAALHPDAEIAPLLRALAAYHSGQPLKARQLLEPFRAHPALPAGWRLVLAEVFLDIGETQQAAELLDALLEQQPGHAAAQIAKAELLLTENRAAAAAAAARRAVELDRFSERAHLALTQALRTQGLDSEARTTATAAAKLFPESPASLRALAECIREEDPWGADMLLARAETSESSVQLDSRRWQYQLLTEDTERKLRSSSLRLIHDTELAGLPVPECSLEATEVLACIKTGAKALLRKPDRQGEAAQIEFIGEPSFKLVHGITERCRRLRIGSVRTWSVQPGGTGIFHALQQSGYQSWMKVHSYRVSGNSASRHIEPLVAGLHPNRPEELRIAPLAELPWESVKEFIARHLPMTSELLGPGGFRQVSPEISAVALLGHRIVGVFINRIIGGTVHCPYLAVDDTESGQHILPLLFEFVLREGTARGCDAMEFMAHADYFPRLHAMLEHLEPESKTELQGMELLIA